MKVNAAAFLVVFIICLVALGKVAKGSIGEAAAQTFAAFFFLGFIVCLIWPEKKDKTLQMAKPKKRRCGKW